MKYSLYRRELDAEKVEYQIKPGWMSSTFTTSQWYDDRRIRDHVFKIYQHGLRGTDWVDEFNKPMRVTEYDDTDYWAIRFYPPSKYEAKTYYGLYVEKNFPTKFYRHT